MIFLFLFLWPGNVRPIDPKNKICSNFEAVMIMRPGLMSLNSGNDLKEKLYHLYWGVRSSSANFVFIKSASISNFKYSYLVRYNNSSLSNLVMYVKYVLKTRLLYFMGVKKHPSSIISKDLSIALFYWPVTTQPCS